MATFRSSDDDRPTTRSLTLKFEQNLRRFSPTFGATELNDSDLTLGPGYCHFLIAYQQEFFEQLTSEEARMHFVRGHPVRYWFKPSGKRNEALDRRVYALAALHARPVSWEVLLRDAPPNPRRDRRRHPREAPPTRRSLPHLFAARPGEPPPHTIQDGMTT